MSDPGFVYLIHFAEPIAHAQHYIGWAKNLSKRIAAHRDTFWEPCDPYQTDKYGLAVGSRQGKGATLIGVANYRGIGWQVARVWRGDRNIEKRLKGSHRRCQFCPICNPERAWDRGAWAPKGRLPRVRMSAILQPDPLPAWWPKFAAADLALEPAPVDQIIYF